MSEILHHAYREATFISGGEHIVLSLWERKPLRNGDAAPVILFYPSTMASPLLHQTLLETLWTRGFTVAGLHPIGHGKSPNSNDFTFGDIVRNGLDAETWLRKQYKSPFVVSGHSQGGICTLAHALQSKNLAAAYSLGTLLPQHPDAPTVTRFKDFVAYRDIILEKVHVLAKQFPRFPVFMPFYLEFSRSLAGAPKDIFSDIPTAMAQLRASYPAHFVDSLFSTDLSAATIPGNITCPYTVIVAQNDGLFPPELMEKMLVEIQAPQKQLLILEGGGHVAPASAQYAPVIAGMIATDFTRLGYTLEGEHE